MQYMNIIKIFSVFIATKRILRKGKLLKVIKQSFAEYQLLFYEQSSYKYSFLCLEIDTVEAYYFDQFFIWACENDVEW